MPVKTKPREPADNPTSILDVELKFFEKNRAKLCRQHLHKFVVIKGNKLLGVYETQEQAFIEGVETFDLDGFLIKQVELEDEIIDMRCHFLSPL